MVLNQLWIVVKENEWSYLITTPFDSWIYAEWDTVEDALINFLDVYKTVKELKWEKTFVFDKTEESLFHLPVTV